VVGGQPLTVVRADAGTHVATLTMLYVYLPASKPYGTLYVGMTSNLLRRVSSGLV